MAVAQMASHEILCSELGKRGAISTVVDMFHEYENDIPLQQQVRFHVACILYVRITCRFDQSVAPADVVGDVPLQRLGAWYTTMAAHTVTRRRRR